MANNADLDEVPLHVAFHLSLRCLPKYPFRSLWLGIRNVNGSIVAKKSDHDNKVSTSKEVYIGFELVQIGSDKRFSSVELCLFQTTN